MSIGPTDPTLDKRLVELRRQVVAQDFVQCYLNGLRSGSMGLVLAGGGGKGAYEGGVLLALYDCGLDRYDAIAGTSVGALNAALAHQLFDTKDRHVVTRLWGDLSPRRVLSWSVFRTPLGFLVRIGVFLSALVPWLPARLMAVLENKSSAQANEWAGILYRLQTLAVIVPFGIVLAIVLVILLILHGWPLALSYGVNLAIGILFVSSLFLKSRDAVGRYLSLASNAPLLRTIRENIDVTALRRENPPVYCTMARESSWWDPFEVSDWSNVSDGATRRSQAPVYLSLADATSDEEAMEWLLQTAALPEIFPRKPIRGQYAVDGGITDNVPIYPVAAHKPDRIFVVYLNHRLTRNNWLYTDEAARTWWMAEHKALSELVTRQQANAVRQHYIAKHGPVGHEKPRLIPLEPRLISREQFLPIVPNVSLGNLLTGTLNFTTKKARRLLMLGYRDTLLWIEAYAKYENATAHQTPKLADPD